MKLIKILLHDLFKVIEIFLGFLFVFGFLYLIKMLFIEKLGIILLWLFLTIIGLSFVSGIWIYIESLIERIK